MKFAFEKWPQKEFAHPWDLLNHIGHFSPEIFNTKSDNFCNFLYSVQCGKCTIADCRKMLTVIKWFNGVLPFHIEPFGFESFQLGLMMHYWWYQSQLVWKTGQWSSFGCLWRLVSKKLCLDSSIKLTVCVCKPCIQRKLDKLCETRQKGSMHL